MDVPTAPLRLLLDSEALVANWRWLASKSGRAACGAAIKADGYGLGARGVMEHLAGAGCRDFFVATWEEAIAVGQAPYDGSLAVFHGARAVDMPIALSGLARPVLNSAAQVSRWKVAGGGACNVMIDTGMNRLGLSPEEARSGLLEGLQIDTLMSHLACADEADSQMNEQQLFAFRGLMGAIPAKRYSLSNSAGICLGPRYAFQLTRPGLALYGGIPRVEAAEDIRPVVRPEAEVIQIRQVSIGGVVGYGATFRANRPTQLAIVNLGYADGFLRSFAERGVVVRFDGVACPIIGRISMDMLAVDVTDAGQVQEGDWLAIDYSLPEMSVLTGLSQYELLTGLGHRYQRIWI